MDNFEINFANPIELGDLNKTEKEDTVKEPVVEEEPKQEPVVENTTEPEETPVIETSVETETISDSSFEVEADGIANALSELGFIDSVPDGVDVDEFDMGSLKKLLTYRDDTIKKETYEKAVNEERQRIVSKLTPSVQQIVAFNLEHPNADDGDVKGFIESMDVVKRITELDPDSDAEKIVREYYKSAGFTYEEVEEKVEDLVELNKLKREASRLKPKLDAKAQEIVKEEKDKISRIREYEEHLQQNLNDRVMAELKKERINGINITREEASFVYNALLNNEVPVMIKGKQVEMGFLEALVMREKYEGNLENVMLAALVLNGGSKAIEKFFANEAKKEEVEKIVNQIKFSNRKRKSVQPGSSNSTGEGDGFRITF